MTNLKLDPVDHNPPGPPHNPACAIEQLDLSDFVLYAEHDAEPKTEAIRSDIILNLRKTL